jgi:hypothetical protein
MFDDGWLYTPPPKLNEDLLASLVGDSCADPEYHGSSTWPPEYIALGLAGDPSGSNIIWFLIIPAINTTAWLTEKHGYRVVAEHLGSKWCFPKVKKGRAGSNLNRRGASRIFDEIGDNKPALKASAVADF